MAASPRHCAASVIGVSLALLLSVSWASAANVLFASGFEEGQPGIATWWGKPSVSTENPHGGQRCVRLTDGACVATDALPIQGRRLGLRLWLRGVDIVRGPAAWNNLTVQACYFDAAGKQLDHTDLFHAEGTMDWREVTGQVRGIPGAATVRLAVNLWNATGTATLDDMTVTLDGVDLEAEALDLKGTPAVAVAEASGQQAVALTAPEQSLSTRLDLPAGDYTVLVRARALQPDTFTEVGLLLDGREIATLTPTCPIFTRARRHFSLPEGGKPELALRWKEGAGAMVDQITIQGLTTGLAITSLKPLTRTTNLGGAGKAACVIVPPPGAAYAPVAEDLASKLAPLLGARPAVIPADKVDRTQRGSTTCLYLGDNLTNHELLALSPNPFFMVPRPEPGQASLLTWADPWGTGRNAVVLGGRDPQTVAQAVAMLWPRLQQDEQGVSLPWTWEPQPLISLSREQFRQLVVDSGKWLRQGGLRTLQNQWKQNGVEAFRVLGYRYLEYRDSADTIARVADDGFTDAELVKIIPVWNAYEEFPQFTDAERLQLTNLLHQMALICEGPYSRYLFGLPNNLPHQEIVERLRTEQPALRWNHQTFPAASLYWAGRYFGTTYHLPEAQDWLQFAAAVFAGQRTSAKPRCDCWGYQDITMLEMLRYAVATEDESYLQSGVVDRYLELRLMSYDNQGAACGYGDSGGWMGGGVGPDFYDEGVRWWTNLGVRPDRQRLAPASLCGLKAHPMEPAYYDTFRYDGAPPTGQCFDKLTFRQAVDPARAYLLLDGISGGNHGHWDGNSIVRFTDNGRVWLGEGDYLYGDPKDHNTLTLTRDGLGGLPDRFASLESRATLPGLAATQTRVANVNGATWDRHLLWLRNSDIVLAFDRVQAREGGQYDLKVRYRVRGAARQSSQAVDATQQGNERFRLLNGSGDQVRLTSDERDGETNWKSYPFSTEPATKLVWHRWVGPLEPGQEHCFAGAFYAAGPTEPTQLAAAPAGPGVQVLNGAVNAVAGVLPPQGADLPQVDARQYLIGPERLVLIAGTRLAWAQPVISADAPINLELDLQSGRGHVSAAAQTTVTLALPPGTTVQVDAQTVAGKPLALAPGEHSLQVPPAALAGLRAGLSRSYETLWKRVNMPPVAVTQAPADSGLAQDWAAECGSAITALTAADVNGDGAAEAVAGTEAGLVLALDAAGQRLWTHSFGARVNDLASVDLDGDKHPEIVCGVEDQTVYALKGGGQVLWQHPFEPDTSQGGGPGHVRVVTAGDFEGDGKPEVAVGGANSWFVVLDNAGQVRWQRQAQHKASAIGLADVDGDGFQDLLCGYTYQSRMIVDFKRSGWDQVRSIGGCIAGCRTVTAGDVDGDGKPEAIFGDKDGRLLAGKKGPPYAITPVYQLMLGDDELTRCAAADVDGDGKAEVACTSLSEFAALVGAGGKVRWVFPTGSAALDVALVNWRGATQPALAVACESGRVLVLDATGRRLGQLQVPAPASRVIGSGTPAAARLLVVAGNSVLSLSAPLP